MIVLLALGALAATPTDLVVAGSDWSYLDSGVDPDPTWASTSYDDSAWSTGPGTLGFGVFEDTTIDGGDPVDRHITTWFRHTFTVTNPADYTGLVLELIRDDGAVVYLNGVEVHRSNMPAVSDASTPASSDVVGAEEYTFLQAPLDASALVAGDNVLAVEVHQSSSLSDDLAFDAALVGWSGDPVLTRGPYLQQVTPDSIVVRWRTDAPTEAVVTTLAGPQASGPVALDHEVLLDGLSPDTRYTYEVGTPSVVLAGGAAPYQFTTSPLPGTIRPVKLWVLGDSGTADANAEAVADGFASLGEQADLWLMLGDNAYNSGTDDEYQDAVFDLYTDHLPGLPLWSTLGNHDGYTASSATQSGPYYDIFTHPTAGEAGGEPSGTEAYYSFDYANLHVICLDSYDSDRSASSAMVSWLQDDLAATTADWVIAFWHHPPYSKGSHNSDVESNLVEMRQNVVPILEDYGVDLVLGGHSHSYERSALIDGHHGLSATFDTRHVRDNSPGDATLGAPYTKPSPSGGSNEGAVYVVAGSSGKTSGGALDHPVMLTSLSVLGSVVIDIDGPTLTARFVDDAGQIVDRFDIERGITSILELYATDPPSEGEAVGLHAYGQDPDGNEVVSYEWDFGDGSPIGTGPDQVHLWPDDGVVPVTVTVVDLAGDTISRTLDLPVANEPPKIVDYGADPAMQGIPTAFWVDATDVATDTITYSWDFGDGALVFGDEVEHIFLVDGTYTVTVQAADEDGGVSTASLEVVVSGTPPEDQVIYVSAAFEGSPVALSAGNDDQVVSWSWDLHDGLPERLGQSITHTWADDGTFPVTLTTTDAEGDTNVRQVNVPVANVAPSDLQISTVELAVEGDTLTFVGSATDPGDDVLSYIWSFGDLSPVVTAPSVQHRYGDEGTYSVSLAVSDGDGGVGSMLTAVTVTNAPPTAASLVLPSSVQEGQLASFSVVPYDPGDDEVTVTWALGDGTSSDLTELQHAYDDDGLYSVLLTLDDGDGGLVTIPHQVAVNNVAPQLSGVPADTVVLGAVYRFTPTVTDPGSDTHTFTLSGPDDAVVGPTGSVSWTPTRTVRDVPFTLTVDDGDATASMSWTVSAEPVPAEPGAYDGPLSNQSGCGCASTAPASAAWLLGLLPLLLRRRQ